MTMTMIEFDRLEPKKTIDIEKYDMKAVRRTVKRFNECLDNDKCENTDCLYFSKPYEIAEAVKLLNDIVGDIE